MPDDTYANIREILRPFIGKRLEDVSQHDADEFAENGEAYVVLLFEGGGMLEFPVATSFHIEEGP